MDAAFELLALQRPERSFVGIERQRRAGLAADARVADGRTAAAAGYRALARSIQTSFVVHVASGLTLRSDLPTADETARLRRDSRRRRGLLDGASPVNHMSYAVERRKERPDLVAGAAGVRARLPETRLRFGGAKVHEVQVPACGELVAIGVGLGEVMHGVEEQDRNVGSNLPQHVQDDHVFGLEAARDARPAWSPRLSAITELPRRLELSVDDWSIMSGSPRALSGRPRVASASDAARARQSCQPLGGASAWPRPRRAPEPRFTIMPAPAVKLVAGSIRMKLPVARFSA